MRNYFSEITSKYNQKRFHYSLSLGGHNQLITKEDILQAIKIAIKYLEDDDYTFLIFSGICWFFFEK